MEGLFRDVVAETEDGGAEEGDQDEGGEEGEEDRGVGGGRELLGEEGEGGDVERDGARW